MAFKYYRCITSQGWRSSTALRARSKTERKVAGLLGGFKDSALLEHDHADGNIVHMFRADPTNCGDWWSLPARYFTFPLHDNVVDVNDYGGRSLLKGMVILGGGGLIGPAFRQIGDMLGDPGIRCIGWGLGDNMLDDKRSGYVGGFTDLPDYIRQFKLLGIRDVIDGLRWVPCASCMHPVFSENYERRHDVVVLEHKRIPLGIKGVPTMTNNGNDIEQIVRFIASGDTVVTNSYHGAYWAILLGRKCVAIPFSSKFHRMRHPATLCQPGDWKSGMVKATIHDNALAESRLANVRFYADVMELLA